MIRTSSSISNCVQVISRVSDATRRRYDLFTAGRENDFMPGSIQVNDVVEDLNRIKSSVVEDLKNFRSVRRNLKWYLAPVIRLRKVKTSATGEDQELIANPTFHSKTRVLLVGADDVQIDRQYCLAVGRIVESLEQYVNGGSGWMYDYIVCVDLFMVKYEPLYASSYIPTPKKIANARCSVVNIKNHHDNKCFLWSVLAALHPDPSRQYRITYYKKFLNSVSFEGLEFPVKISDVDIFERVNNNISINVFGYDQDEPYPIRITNFKNRSTHINLLLLTRLDNFPTRRDNTHYCLIKNLNAFLAQRTKNQGKSHYCYYCLHRFTSHELLRNHNPLCETFGAQKIKLPSPQSDKRFLYFRNFRLTHKVPFTIYCSFESFQAPIGPCENQNSTEHVPSGFCYIIVDDQSRLVKPPVVFSETGRNILSHLLNCLTEEVEYLKSRISSYGPLETSHQDEQEFAAAKECHLCQLPFRDNDAKCRNRDSTSGKYLGAAHQVCNLNHRVPGHVPVFFHNLKRYDYQNLMTAFEGCENYEIKCTPACSERFISVSLGPLRFLDSLNLLNAPLEQLIGYLACEGSDKFIILNQCVSDANRSKLMLRRGLYPYEFMTDETKFNLTQLPDKEFFNSKLINSRISDEDYSHAQNVWKTFKFTCMKDYHDYILLSDTILFSDVFERFRDTSLLHFQIDPSNMFSSTELSWQAMLKMTGVKLELLTDIKQHSFLEKSMRGSVSMISHRHAKANNVLLSDYDPNLETSYLLYLHCNNLYSAAMLSHLPIADFRWLDENETAVLDFLEVPDDNNTGYILEVDLEYDKSLHDRHSDYPLAPESRTVDSDELYSTLRMEEFETEGSSPATKVIASLHHKKHYVLHYRNLKLYHESGLRLTKVHKALEFRQSPWLAPFVRYNLQKRETAENAFDREFFQNAINSIYGKMLESARMRNDFKLIDNEKQLARWASDPRLVDFSPYNNRLVGLSLKCPTANLFLPIPASFALTEMNKHIMYSFHYKWAVKNYGGRVKLCMADANSFLYHIKTNNVYEDMQKDIGLFDTSDYPIDHFCHSASVEQTTGVFKDEMNSVLLKEFAGLRPKCFSLMKQEMLSAEAGLKHDHYVKFIANSAICRLSDRTTFTSTRQSGLRVSKLCLYNSERHIMADGVSTLAFGHYKIDEKRERNIFVKSFNT